MTLGAKRASADGCSPIAEARQSLTQAADQRQCEHWLVRELRRAHRAADGGLGATAVGRMDRGGIVSNRAGARWARTESISEGDFGQGELASGDRFGDHTVAARACRWISGLGSILVR